MTNHKLKIAEDKWSTFESGNDIEIGLEKAWSGVFFTLLIFLITLPIVFTVFSVIANYVGFPNELLLAVAFLGCGGIGAAVFPMLASCLAIGIVVGINWSFSGLLGQRTAVVIFGTLSGYLSTIWLLLLWGKLLVVGPQILSVIFVCLAMVAGYLGGIGATTRKGVWKHRDSDLADKQYQFEIYHIFVLTFWICLLLAFDRLIGNYRVLVLFGLYAFVQFGILLFDVNLRNWKWYLRLASSLLKKPKGNLS